MYFIRAIRNQLEFFQGGPEVYVFTGSFLSRRYIFFNVGLSSKGPSSVLYSIRDALLGLKIKHKLVSNTNLNILEKISRQSQPAKVLLLSTQNDENLIETIKRINSSTLILGPNIDMSSELGDFLIENPNLYKKFLVPSEQVIESVTKATPSFKEIKKQVWPVGIDTKKWSPSKIQTKRQGILLVYMKGDISPYDKEIISNLSYQHTQIEFIRYGMYKPLEYRAKLRRARAVAWFGIWESQGIAMLEAWSCNIPTFVRVHCDCAEAALHLCKNTIKFSPYLNDTCGHFFRTEKELRTLLKSLNEVSSDFPNFSPRAWVKQNLETKKQLFHLLNS